MKDMNRRKFFGHLLQLSGALIAMPVLLKATSAQAEAAKTALPMVDPKDPLATSLKYVEDATKNPMSKGNKCSTCALYKKLELRGGKEVGACVLFAGKAVNANGFCNSWNKKPA